jgi:aquaporin Z
MQQALRRHWPEYLMEAAGLGLFMLAACAFTVLLYHPSTFAGLVVEPPLLRRLLMGLAMGLTAVALMCSASRRSRTWRCRVRPTSSSAAYSGYAPGW